MKEPAEVIEAMFQDAQRRDPQHRKTGVVLVDGNETQLRMPTRALGAVPPTAAQGAGPAGAKGSVTRLSLGRRR
jgi:hypothetical protein